MWHDLHVVECVMTDDADLASCAGAVAEAVLIRHACALPFIDVHLAGARLWAVAATLAKVAEVEVCSGLNLAVILLWICVD